MSEMSKKTMRMLYVPASTVGEGAGSVAGAFVSPAVLEWVRRKLAHASALLASDADAHSVAYRRGVVWVPQDDTDQFGDVGDEPIGQPAVWLDVPADYRGAEFVELEEFVVFEGARGYFRCNEKETEAMRYETAWMDDESIVEWMRMERKEPVSA